MENTIVLLKQGNCWNAHHKGPHARKIMDLFGTPILPLPFTPQADAQFVLDEVSTKNQDINVILG